MCCLKHSPSLGTYGRLDKLLLFTNKCFMFPASVSRPTKETFGGRMLVPELARLLRPPVQFRTSHGTKKSLQNELVFFFAYLLRQNLFLDWHFQKARKYKIIRWFMAIGILHFSKKKFHRNFELTFPKLQDLYASVNFSRDATFIVRFEVLAAMIMNVYHVVYFGR
jgi:hypothetical protein